MVSPRRGLEGKKIDSFTRQTNARRQLLEGSGCCCGGSGGARQGKNSKFPVSDGEFHGNFETSGRRLEAVIEWETVCRYRK